MSTSRSFYVFDYTKKLISEVRKGVVRPQPFMVFSGSNIFYNTMKPVFGAKTTQWMMLNSTKSSIVFVHARNRKIFKIQKKSSTAFQDFRGLGEHGFVTLSRSGDLTFHWRCWFSRKINVLERISRVEEICQNLGGCDDNEINDASGGRNGWFVVVHTTALNRASKFIVCKVSVSEWKNKGFEGSTASSGAKNGSLCSIEIRMLACIDLFPKNFRNFHAFEILVKNSPNSLHRENRGSGGGERGSQCADSRVFIVGLSYSSYQAEFLALELDLAKNLIFELEDLTHLVDFKYARKMEAVEGSDGVCSLVAIDSHSKIMKIWFEDLGCL